MATHAWIVRAQFYALGFCMGSWGVHVPSVRAHFGLSDAALSVALLVAAGGAVACLVGATAAVERLGLRPVLMAAGVVMCTALAGVLWLPPAVPFVALLALMLAYGVGSALFDVSMNTQGSAVESQGGRKVMSGFHGMWSAGGMSGAFCVSWLHSQGVDPAQQMLWVNVVAMLVMVASGAWTQSLVARHTGASGEGARADGATAPPVRRSIWPGGLLLTMGALACVAMVAEGAMYDWSTLYLQREVGVAPALAAVTFGVFSAAMALGRFAGDWVRTHVQPVPLMQASGALGAVGMGLALAFGRIEVAMIGFVLVGLALSNVVPVVFAAAAQVDPKRPTHGIATVSVIGYFGFVAGPVLIGFVAEHSSLRWALALVVLFCAAFGLAAKRGLRAP
jgi:MFS family permease